MWFYLGMGLNSIYLYCFYNRFWIGYLGKYI